MFSFVSRLRNPKIRTVVRILCLISPNMFAVVMEESCGVFGCVATGEWPTELEVANIICLGLTGLQHR